MVLHVISPARYAIVAARGWTVAQTADHFLVEPAKAACAAPRVPIRGAPGQVCRLVVEYHASRKHLPVVKLAAA